MATIRTRRNGWALAALVLIAGSALVTACGGTGESAKPALDSAGSSADEGRASSSGAAATATKLLTDGKPVGAQVDESRDVIYTGSLTVRVSDAEKAAAKASALADEGGGYLARQDAELEGDQQVEVTLRIPADSFHDVMKSVEGLGDVQARKVDSEDVTDQVVDLQGHLENAQTSAKRLRELLAAAENVQNVITIEERLTQRETEIESITGQLEVLKDQVELATVRATFTEKAAPTVSDDLPGPLEAMKAGGVAVVNVLIVAVAALGFLVPFVPFLLVGWWLIRRWRRAHPKGPRQGAPGSPLPPPPGPSAHPGPAAAAAPAA